MIEEYEVPTTTFVKLEDKASDYGMSVSEYIAFFCARVIESMTSGANATE